MRTQVGSGVLNYILANTGYRLSEVSRASVTITHTDSFTNKHAFYGSLQHPKTHSALGYRPRYRWLERSNPPNPSNDNHPVNSKHSHINWTTLSSRSCATGWLS